MDRKGVTADLLRSRTKRQVIKILCEDLVRMYDAAIAAANENGFFTYVAEVPTVFQVQGMSPKEVKVVIYSELIQTYIDKGMDVQIDINDAGTFLHISWKCGLTQDEYDERLALIRAHIKKTSGPSSKDTK